MPKQKNSSALKTGFTIVELLIVIVVIGILAALVLNSFTSAQDKARRSKVANDITVLHKAILNARTETGKTLFEITGNGCSRCSCPYLSGDTTPYNTLDKSHNCWARYYDVLTKVGAAANTNLDQLREGDPWGSPYSVDENEGEQPANPCRADQLASLGKSANQNGGTSLNALNLRFSLSACI